MDLLACAQSHASALDIYFSKEPVVAENLDLTYPLYVRCHDIEGIGESRVLVTTGSSLKCMRSASSR